MRKLVLLVFGIIISLTSCKKDKGTGENEPSRDELIVGKWESEFLEYYTVWHTDGDTTDRFVLPGGNITMDLKADKSLTVISLGDTAQGIYELNGNMLTMMHEDTFSGNITQLTKSRLVIDSEVEFTDTAATQYQHIEFVK